MDKLKGLNSYHRVAVKSHLRFLQGKVYKVTEHDETLGKFGEYQDILNSIVKYSNEFFEYTKTNRSEEEWLYMIPSYSMYATLGFLSGIKTEEISKNIDFHKEEKDIIARTLNVVGHLTDVLHEHKERVKHNRERDSEIPKKEKC